MNQNSVLKRHIAINHVSLAIQNLIGEALAHDPTIFPDGKYRVPLGGVIEQGNVYGPTRAWEPYVLGAPTAELNDIFGLIVAKVQGLATIEVIEGQGFELLDGFEFGVVTNRRVSDLNPEAFEAGKFSFTSNPYWKPKFDIDRVSYYEAQIGANILGWSTGADSRLLAGTYQLIVSDPTAMPTFNWFPNYDPSANLRVAYALGGENTVANDIDPRPIVDERLITRLEEIGVAARTDINDAQLIGFMITLGYVDTDTRRGPSVIVRAEFADHRSDYDGDQLSGQQA